MFGGCVMGNLYQKAGIMPSSEQIAKYSSAIGPSVPLHSILVRPLCLRLVLVCVGRHRGSPSAIASQDRIAESSVLADDFFMCRLQSMQAAAKLLSKVPNLRMEDRYTLCCAPIRTNDPELADFFLQVCGLYTAAVSPASLVNTPFSLHPYPAFAVPKLAFSLLVRWLDSKVCL